ncbi:MAG: hypothetical protein ACK4N5_03930 [Myxococcales bacterium]
MVVSKAVALKALSRASRNMKDIRDMDELLDKLGLERKHPVTTVFTGLGFFALGLLVGSAVGLVLAPMTGNEMRSVLREQGVKGMMDRSRSTMPQA